MKKWTCIALMTAFLLALIAFAGSAETVGTDLAGVLEGFGLGDEMMLLVEEDLTDIYGIDPADVAQFAAAINDTGIKADEIVLVEAVDAAAAARIEAALEERYQSKLNELENYLPEEYAVVKACGVETDGNFVSMIVAPNAAELVELYRAGLK